MHVLCKHIYNFSFLKDYIFKHFFGYLRKAVCVFLFSNINFNDSKQEPSSEDRSIIFDLSTSFIFSEKMKVL